MVSKTFEVQVRETRKVGFRHTGARDRIEIEGPEGMIEELLAAIGGTGTVTITVSPGITFDDITQVVAKTG